jgi:lysophospholipase L1-like esterase
VRPAQRITVGALGLAGAAAVAAPLALLAASLLGRQGVTEGFGLYRILMLAGGVALLVRALDLRDVTHWDALRDWWSSERRWPGVGHAAALIAQGLLLIALLRTFQIETPAFWRLIAPLALVGGVIHHLTPRAHRPAMFLALSLAAIWLVFPGTDALWMVAIGALLVGLCHLPVPFGVRVASVAAFGLMLALSRTGRVPVPWSAAVWPILGSMFMFRMIVYLYDLRHETGRVPWTQRLGYFFLLPNVVFPLFPVVDYTTFKDTHYDSDAHRIYQRGVEWILRGIVQLILYRIIYQYWVIPQSEARSAGAIAQFIVTGYLLYVRVSGQFHIISGILHLFGYHLPETHRRYFLASSFSDSWRRINIYWTNFMMKVFYFPVWFRLKGLGEERAMVGATIVVFVTTWLLHSYQWFWLLGSFPITLTDGLFWGILGVILVVTTLREARRGRRRILGPAWTPGAVGRHALGALGTFAAMSVLWSIWMSPSFDDWLAMFTPTPTTAANATRQGLLPPLLLGGAIVGSGLASSPLWSWLTGQFVSAETRRFPHRVAFVITMALGLILVGRPTIAGRISDRVAGLIATIGTPQLNAADATDLQRGYYEDLIGVSRLNSQLWEAYMQRPPGEQRVLLENTPAARETGDFTKTELVPFARIEFMGQPLRVNRWGMRDRDYDREKPPGTKRIALLGVSIDMGWGVADGESYEELTVDALNAGSARPRVQILNFSVASHTVADHLIRLDSVLAWAPDAVIIPAQEVRATLFIDHLIERGEAGVASGIPVLDSAAQWAGVGRVPRPVARGALQTVGDSLVQELHRQIVRKIRARGAIPFWMYTPVPEAAIALEDVARMEADARASGFEIIDISNALDGVDPQSLRLRSYDRHPNKEGHRLLAARLTEALRAQSLLSEGASMSPGAGGR